MNRQQEFRKQTEEAKLEAFSMMCRKVAELEAENAELKHTIAELRRDKDNLNTHTKAQKKLSEYRSEQLTKAREIIKKFLLWENDWHNKTESKYELLKEAEQFLNSEVEK